MSKEPAMYRPILEQLLMQFGNKRILSVTDVSKYTGKGPEWCRKHLNASGGMSVERLAMELAKF